MCYPQTRKILPAIVTTLSSARGNGSGSQSSGSSSLGTSSRDEDMNNRPVNPRLVWETPSGPCTPKPGWTSSNSGLSLPPSEEPPLPIMPDLGDHLPLDVPQVATPSSLVLIRGNANPKRYTYDNRSNISFISSIPPPKVFSTPHVPLSFLGEPNLQISHTTPGELELTL